MMQVHHSLFYFPVHMFHFVTKAGKTLPLTIQQTAFIPRLQCHSLPITMAVPGLPVWTGYGRGQEAMHVYLVAISCDVICNSQLEPARAESSLVCSEEITVFQ